MDELSIGAVSAWQQQQVAQQIGIAVLKKAMDMETQNGAALVQMVTEAAPATAATATVGQNLDISV